MAISSLADRARTGFESERGPSGVPGFAVDAAPLTRADALIAAAFAVVAFVLHPLLLVVRRPYWLDEMWVASLSRAPLSKSLALSSSTPIGWEFLLRLVPGGMSGWLRVVPLAFGVASVAIAFLFARSLSWATRGDARRAGVAAATVVLLAPAALARNDLKQYTADACFALLLFLLLARAETQPTARRLATLGGVATAALWFSSTSAFVAVATLGALLFVHRRAAPSSVRRIRWTTIGTMLAVGCYFAAVVLPRDNGPLRAFWNDFYLPTSPSLVTTIWSRLQAVAPWTSMPAFVLIALAVIGAVRVGRIGQPAVALAFALLWVEAVAAGVSHRYPFLDVRTSHYLIMVTLVMAAVGALRIVEVVSARWSVSATSVLLVLIALYAANGMRYVGSWATPSEDSHAEVTYVAQNRRGEEPIVVSFPSNYAFSAYWPGAHVQYGTERRSSIGFATTAPGLPGVVYAAGISPADTTRALSTAVDDAHHVGSRRVWIIRTHLRPDEYDAWQIAFRTSNVRPHRIRIGRESVWLVPVSTPTS